MVYRIKNKHNCALIILAILIASAGTVGAYSTLQTQNLPLEVREPLEISIPFQSISLYPGETTNFSVNIENHASVSYNVSLICSLNDTQYENQYVTFNNGIYVVQPGTNRIDSWLYVSSTAPAAKLDLIVNVTRDIQNIPIPTTLPTPQQSNSAASLKLFTAGAKWAANNGTSVLYIDWYDNYILHHSDPNYGQYWREGQLLEIKDTTVKLLEEQGFKVTCAGDVPADLSGYNLVIFEAWFAVEPQHSQPVREYLSNGGNVVIIGGVPCYFATYCKDIWPGAKGGTNLMELHDWFGSAQFVNSGGTASLIVDQPFGVYLQNQSVIYHIDAYGCYALTSMNNGTQVIGRWADGSVYSFTHEYGKGRVFYQAEMDW